MKDKILRSVIIAVTVSIGVNLIMFLEGNEFSPLNAILGAVLAFAVNFALFSLFDKLAKKGK